MTVEKLQEILQSDDKLGLNDAKEIIYELKNDCVMFNEDPYKAGFYNGQMNAFYICLDLLDKVDPLFVGIEERVSKLEQKEKMREIRERVASLLSSMCYGKLGVKGEDVSYYKMKLNEIFGNATYVDTDCCKSNDVMDEVET